MSKILLTGYRGFIGQNMLLSLLPEHDLVLYEWGEKHPSFEGIDWIIHLGAISSTTERDVNKILTQNVDYSIWLLDQAIKHNINFQWASSASVYGNSATKFCETSPPAPATPYAWSKYLFERHIQKLGKQSIRIQGFRYFNVYGPHEDHKTYQSSPHHAFTQQAINTGIIQVFEGSEQYCRDFVPVQNIIHTHKKFFNVVESGVWNIGTGSAISFMDVAMQIAEQYDAEIVTIPFPKHLLSNYQSYTCADLTKLNQTLSDAGLL